MSKSWGAALSAAVAIAVLSGCGGGASSAATKTITKTVTATTTVTTGPEEPDPAAATSSAASGALAVGKTVNLEGNKVTVIRIEEKPAARTDGLIGSDQRFIGAQVKYCLSDAASLSYAPWRIIGRDGGEYEAIDVSPFPTNWPQPAYPYDLPDDPQRSAGSCVTGWMMFGVNKSTKAAKVVYRGQPGTAEWKAP